MICNSECCYEVINVKKELKTYSSKEVAERLSIQPVTVRKYSQMLENQGFEFIRDDKGWRFYSDDNIVSMQYIVNMKAAGKSLNESIEHVATLYRSNLSLSSPALPLHEPNSMTEFIKVQHVFNQKVIERLEASEKRQIERDSNLMKAIRDTQEVKRQIAVSREKKWWKFWK